MSATSALPTLTGSFASGFFPAAFIATSVMTMAITRTIPDHTASFFFRLPLIGRSSVRLLRRITTEEREGFTPWERGRLARVVCPRRETRRKLFVPEHALRARRPRSQDQKYLIVKSISFFLNFVYG